MTIHLPEDLERFVHDAVRQGRYAREDDVIKDALTKLKQSNREGATMSDPRTSLPGRSRRSPSLSSTTNCSTSGS